MRIAFRRIAAVAMFVGLFVAFPPVAHAQLGGFLYGYAIGKMLEPPPVYQGTRSTVERTRTVVQPQPEVGGVTVIYTADEAAYKGVDPMKVRQIATSATIFYKGDRGNGYATMTLEEIFEDSITAVLTKVSRSGDPVPPPATKKVILQVVRVLSPSLGAASIWFTYIEKEEPVPTPKKATAAPKQ